MSGGGFQIIDDGTGDSAVSAFLTGSIVDLSVQRLEAEFDIVMSSNGSTADGVVFAIVDFLATTAVGGGGGSMGFAGGSIPSNSIGVEFDLWNGGTDDVGFNTGDGGQIALIDGSSVGHVQDDNDLAPSFVFPASFDMLNPAGLHVEVVVETPRVRVWASGVDNEGSTIPRRLVIDASSWSATQILQGSVGFTGGTGGATADALIDNLRVCTGAAAAPAPELVVVKDGLGSAPDTFTSPLGENVPFDTVDLDLTADVSLVGGAGMTLTSNGGGNHTLTLASPVPVGGCVTLTFDVADLATGAVGTITITLCHLPLDVNQDGVVNIADITTWANEFSAARRAALVDTNGDGTPNVGDATRVGDLWFGRPPATKAWNGEALP